MVQRRGEEEMVGGKEGMGGYMVREIVGVEQVDRQQ